MEAEAPERLAQAESFNWDMAAALQEAAPELWDETVGAFAQVSTYSAPDMTYDPLVAAAEATGVDPSALRLDDLGSVRTTHLTVVSLSDFNGARALQGQDPVELAAGTCALANNMDMVTPLARAVLDAAPKAIADPNDYAARADLMWAGMLAHNNSCGIGREQDWASHQIEHELSAFYDCAHGAGLAVILPAWMEYVLPHDPVRLAQFAVRVFGCEMNFADPEATARQGIEKLCLFFHSLGMPITFDELGAKAKDIPDMVAHRAEKPGGFPFGGFVKIQPADMEAILRLAAGEAQ